MPCLPCRGARPWGGLGGRWGDHFYRYRNPGFREGYMEGVLGKAMMGGRGRPILSVSKRGLERFICIGTPVPRWTHRRGARRATIRVGGEWDGEQQPPGRVDAAGRSYFYPIFRAFNLHSSDSKTSSKSGTAFIWWSRE